MDIQGRTWLSLPQTAKDWYLLLFEKVNVVYGEGCTREQRFDPRQQKPATR